MPGGEIASLTCCEIADSSNEVEEGVEPILCVSKRDEFSGDVIVGDLLLPATGSFSRSVCISVLFVDSYTKIETITDSVGSKIQEERRVSKLAVKTLTTEQQGMGITPIVPRIRQGEG